MMPWRVVAQLDDGTELIRTCDDGEQGERVALAMLGDVRNGAVVRHTIVEHSNGGGVWHVASEW